MQFARLKGKHLGTKYLGTKYLGTKYLGTKHLGIKYLGTKYLGIKCLAVGMLLSVVILWMFLWLQIFSISTVKKTEGIWIENGIGGIRIGYLLHRQGLIHSMPMFRIALSLSGSENKLRAGEYQLEAGDSIWNIIQKLKKGQVILRSITIIEGHTVKQIMQQIDSNPHLTGAISQQPLEGSLLPQTYKFQRGMQRQQLLQHMQQAMDVLLDELWAQRDQDILLKNKAEAIILGSLVERETGVPHERGHIAAVFYNRLRNGWALQTDPTLIYWESKKLGVMQRPIRQSDLRRKHPYNTYLNVGLPPSAIANPGEAAIRAVLNPIMTKDFFFVADGTGGHAFAETLPQHNANVKKWRAIEKQRQ